MKNRFFENKIKEMREKNPFMNQTDIAYELIIAGIMSGYFKPGEKVNQEALSQLLDMSRSPIREALFRLESDGMVLKNEKGYKIYEVNMKDYVDFCEFRIRIESFAAYLAARLISKEKLDELKKTLDEYFKAVDSGDEQLISEWDSKFHQIIIQASNNAYLVEAYKKLDLKKNFFIKAVSSAVNCSNSSKKKHLDIYMAINDRNEELAEQVMKSHLSFYLYRLNQMV